MVAVSTKLEEQFGGDVGGNGDGLSLCCFLLQSPVSEPLLLVVSAPAANSLCCRYVLPSE
jgi:hypothetical protein